MIEIAFPLSFEPSGDGMPACIHDANGAIICEAKYEDFEEDVTRPERALKMLVDALSGPLGVAGVAPGPSEAASPAPAAEPVGEFYCEQEIQGIGADPCVKQCKACAAPSAEPGLREALDEIINYSGGADSALEDEYVMERARAALASTRSEL